MMMMMMMNCLCGMVDLRKVFILVSSQDHCQRSSSSQIYKTPQAGFEPVQKLSSGFAEWSCVSGDNHTSQHHKNLRVHILVNCFNFNIKFNDIWILHQEVFSTNLCRICHIPSSDSNAFTKIVAKYLSSLVMLLWLI